MHAEAAHAVTVGHSFARHVIVDWPDWWINPKPHRNRSTCSNERKARLKATEKGADQFVFVMEKLEMVGLAGDEDKFPSEISGGLRKRAGLAMRFGAGATESFSATTRPTRVWTRSGRYLSQLMHHYL